MKISIVIPVYNICSYLHQCLNSILFSNNSQNFEIILVDDGSNDGSEKVCDEYSFKYSNVRVYHTKNEGVSRARNLGIIKSSGEYIWFIDGDDFLLKGSIDYIHEKIRQYAPEIYIFRYFIFKKDQNCNSHGIRHENLYKAKKEEALKTLLTPVYATFVWNKIIQKKLLLNNKIFFKENMKMCEDMNFSYRLYDKIQDFYIDETVIYGYRKSMNSATSITSKERRKDVAVARYEMYLYFLKQYPNIITDNFRRETTASIISYLHFFDDKDNYYKRLSNFILNTRISILTNRYKFEVLSFKYFKFVFKGIGIMGMINRKMKSLILNSKVRHF